MDASSRVSSISVAGLDGQEYLQAAALLARWRYADLDVAFALRLCWRHYGDGVALRRLLRILIVECGTWFAGKQAPVVEFAPP